MPTRRLARIFLAGAVVIAAAGCSRHADTGAQADQANDDRNQVAQHPTPYAQPGQPSAMPASPRSHREARASRAADEARSRADERPAAPRDVVVPAGAQLAVRLDAPVSSASASSGQRVAGELAAPLTVGSDVVAAVGTQVEATVATAVPSGRLGGTANLTLVLTSVRVGGDWRPVVTSSVARGGPGHAKRNARYIGGGAAVGALIGQLLGGNHNTTLRGAAIGAAAGTGAAAATGKTDVTIPAGEVLTFTLTQPLQLRG